MLKHLMAAQECLIRRHSLHENCQRVRCFDALLRTLPYHPFPSLHLSPFESALDLLPACLSEDLPSMPLAR